MNENYKEALDRIKKAKENNQLVLDLSCLQLTEIPFEILDLPQLTSLNLGSGYYDDNKRNQIRDISILKNLTQLTSLNLSRNKLQDISILKNLTQLAYLYLTSTGIQDISVLKNLTQLTILNLDRNPIQNIGALENLTQLTYLHLEDSRTKNTSFLKNLIQLKQLNLRFNHIQDISALKNLTQLIELNLRFNGIKDISALKNLTQLTYLNLKCNPIQDISALKNLTQLNYLDLDLEEGRIQDISALKNLTQLIELNLAWRAENIQNVSPLKNLTQLIYLKSSLRHIQDISALKNLTQLIYLILDYNKIKDIDVLKNLTQLTYLNLDNNQIQNVSVLKNLTQLTYLNLNNNQIQNVSVLKNLTQLISLNLGNNKIEYIDAQSIFELNNLKHLLIQNNPIENIPSVIFNRDINCLPDVRNYFADLNKGAYVNDTLKIVFVGNGRTGKTSLMRILTGEKFDDNESSTHSIYLKSWNPTNNLRFNLWDFGGQYLYHATHRLFLKTDAIIIVLWDLENENQPFSTEINSKTGEKHNFPNHPLQYWLLYIKTLGKNTPTFIVQSKIEKLNHRKKEHPQYDKLADKFQIIDWFHLDSKTKKNIPNFRAELLNYAKQYIENQPKIPQSWYNVRIAIQYLQYPKDNKIPQKQLSILEFKQLCNYQGLNGSSTDTLLNYLHNTGTFFYNKNLFGGQIILDQSWAINAVYALFDRKGLFYDLIEGKNGIFTAKQLQHIWQKYSVEDQALFISFMISCEICFELTTGNKDFQEKQWIAPYLMSETMPALVSDIFEGQFGLYMKLTSEILHYGIIQSFIIRSRGLSDKNNIWRNGIYLNDSSEKAVISAHESTHTIHIHVIGANAKRLLDKIRNQFSISKSFDTRPVEWVSTDGKTYLELAEIEKNIHLGNFTYEGKRYNINDFKDFLNVNPDSIILPPMIVKMSLEQLRTDVLRLIGKAKTKDAIQLIVTWANQQAHAPMQADIAILESAFSNLQNKEISGTIHHSDAAIVHADISSRILELLQKHAEQRKIVSPIVVPPPLPPTGKKIILMISASPADMPMPNVGRQQNAILKAIADTRQEENYELKTIGFMQLQDLHTKIEAAKADIIHFFMHNHAQQGLYFEQGNGSILHLKPPLLASVFKLVNRRRKVDLVFLNACNSMPYVDLLAPIITNIIYTTDLVPDDIADGNNDTVASVFAYKFYCELLAGKSPEEAVEYANLSLALSQMPLSKSNKKNIDEIYQIKTS